MHACTHAEHARTSFLNCEPALTANLVGVKLKLRLSSKDGAQSFKIVA